MPETPELYEERRAAWLVIAASWKRFTPLWADLQASLEPRLAELIDSLSYEARKPVTGLYYVVIQAHHQTGSPLALHLPMVGALLEQPATFMNGEKLARGVVACSCHACCYPNLVSFVPVGRIGLRFEALVPYCPVCGTEFDLKRPYPLEHARYPNGETKPKPKLELYLQTTELLLGTSPLDYGVVIPEIMAFFDREEPS